MDNFKFLRVCTSSLCFKLDLLETFQNFLHIGITSRLIRRTHLKIHLKILKPSFFQHNLNQSNGKSLNIRSSLVLSIINLFVIISNKEKNQTIQKWHDLKQKIELQLISNTWVLKEKQILELNSIINVYDIHHSSSSIVFGMVETTINIMSTLLV